MEIINEKISALSRTLFPKKTTMAATIAKYFPNGVGDIEVTSRNLQTCNVIRKIR